MKGKSIVILCDLQPGDVKASSRRKATKNNCRRELWGIVSLQTLEIISYITGEATDYDYLRT